MHLISNDLIISIKLFELQKRLRKLLNNFAFNLEKKVMKIIISITLALFVLFSSIDAATTPPAAKEIVFGVLDDPNQFVALTLPPDWRMTVEHRGTIRVEATSGAVFLATAISISDVSLSEKVTLELAQEGANNAALTSEAVPRVTPIKTSTAVGAYFSAADRAPKPGEYKYMFQAIVHAQKTRIVVTLLSNANHDVLEKQVLAVINGIEVRGKSI
jgi:hypothetical protein